MQKHLSPITKLPNYELLSEFTGDLFLLTETDNYSGHWENHKYVVVSWKTKFMSGYYEDRGAFDDREDAEKFLAILKTEDTS